MPQAKKLSTGTGRIFEDWPPIPAVAQYQIDAVVEWVGTHRNLRRPLTTTGWLLVVICALEEQEHYLPARRRLANALAEFYGVTVVTPAKGDPKRIRPRYVDSIDAAISTALAEGEIHEEWRTEDGATTGRYGIRRHRYLHPSKQLMATYREAVDRRRRGGSYPQLVDARTG